MGGILRCGEEEGKGTSVGLGTRSPGSSPQLPR